MKFKLSTYIIAGVLLLLCLLTFFMFSIFVVI